MTFMDTNDEFLWATQLADRLDPPPNPHADDPGGWVYGRLEETITRDQRKIMESVRDNRYTAVPSCNDVGKSYSGSRLCTWWIDSHPPGEAFVVTTAPTGHQVGAILWREIGIAHRKGNALARSRKSAPIPGRITGMNEWKLEHAFGADELVAFGRKPADYEPQRMLGQHARYMLVVIDEACGVPQVLYEAIDSLVTNDNARVLAIGNPDDPSSYFETICKPGSGWNVIRLDALESPGMTRERLRAYPDVQELMIREGIPPTDEVLPEDLYDLLIGPMWVSERIKRWGINSPIFSSRVRGQFPTVTIDTLIHPHWVTLAQARELQPRPMMARIGADIARYGTDHTILMLRQGGHCRVVDDIPFGPTTEAAGKIMLRGREISTGGSLLTAPVACVDDSGVGGGVTDVLAENGYPHVPIQAGGRAKQLLEDNRTPRFINRRSELLWNLREALAGPSGTGEDGWLDIDPLDTELAAQLTNIKYSVNSRGQIQVESKDQIKKRRGDTGGSSSPDRADALSYSIAPDEPSFEHRVQTDKMITSDIMTKQW